MVCVYTCHVIIDITKAFVDYPLSNKVSGKTYAISMKGSVYCAGAVISHAVHYRLSLKLLPTYNLGLSLFVCFEIVSGLFLKR